MRYAVLLLALLSGCASEKSLKRTIHSMACHGSNPSVELIASVEEGLEEAEKQAGALTLVPAARKVIAQTLAQFICRWLSKEIK